MTDRYADLRTALERVEKFDLEDTIVMWLHQVSTVRDLLSEYDSLLALRSEAKMEQKG